MALSYRTRSMSNPGGKPRVFFCCHPEDFERYFEGIAAMVLEKQNCALWYDPECGAFDAERRMDLSQMQLFVIPVTARLLRTPNACMDEMVPFALEEHIPILPLMQESGLVQDFNSRFGDLQFLDPNNGDVTAIGFEKKLEKYLDSVLVGDELAQKVRAAFDAYIFLSYRKKDRGHANELMRLIHSIEFCRDIAIWYDEYLVPGENFNDAIAQALEKCDIFALAVTPNLVNEVNYVMTTEYPAAKRTGKPILPAEIVPTDRRKVREKYEGIDDCVDAHDGEELSRELLRTLQRIARTENDRDPRHNFFIGLAYLGGIDVEVDHEKAFLLITEAAEADLPEAVEKLVEMYRTGNGVARDYPTAMRWQEKLAEIYRRIFDDEDGFSYPDDIYEKENYIMEAGEKHAQALFRLGEYMEEARQLRKAIQVYKQLYSFSLEYRSKIRSDYRILTVVDKHNTKRMEELGQKYDEGLRMGMAAYNRMGEMSYQLGNYANALAEYGIAAKAPWENQDERPGKKAWGRRRKHKCAAVLREELAFSYGRIGDVILVWNFSDNEQEKRAEECYRKSLELRKELAAEKADAGTRLALADAYDGLGNVLREKEQFEEALGYYGSALKIRREIAEEHKTVPARREFVASCIRLGDISRLLDRLGEARDYYTEAQELSSSLLEETETDAARYDLHVACGRLGEVCLMAGQPAEAEKWCFAALEIAEDLCGKARSDRGRYDLSLCHYRMGRVRMAQERFAEARECFAEAQKIQKILDNKLYGDEARRALADSYDGLGDAYAALGNPADAAMAYDYAYTQWQLLMQDNGKKSYRLAYADGLIKSADFKREYMGIGSEETYKSAVEVYTHLAEETGEEEMYRRLADSYRRMGDSYRKEMEYRSGKAAEDCRKKADEAYLAADRILKKPKKKKNISG